MVFNFLLFNDEQFGLALVDDEVVPAVAAIAEQVLFTNRLPGQ